MIVLDTTVLSLTFRRAIVSSSAAEELRRLIVENVPLGVPGIVLQELLSGLREPADFARMQEAMAGFPLLLARKIDHLAAARIANDCRRAGISTTAPDCLIVALTVRHNGKLFTTDKDFTFMAKHSNLQLYADVPAAPVARVPGTWADAIKVSDDFDEDSP